MRKRIALLTICPEDDYQHRIMSGIFEACEKYNYDVVVVTPLVQVANYFKDYLHGELNIYELINFDLFDGVIITPIPMTEDRIDSVVNRLLERIQNECKAPVVSAGLAFGDYPVIATDDETAFDMLAEHIITEHGCRDIAVLTGMKDYSLSYPRVNGVKRAMERHGLTLPDDRLYFGDFWYSGGKQIAADIIEKRISMPEAVICASDAMAIGLVNDLIATGIRVPEDIRVTGYDARSAAALNNPPITSFAPDDARTGARCVEYLRSVLEPDAEPIEFELSERGSIKFGETCGCKEDLNYTRAKVVDSLYLINQDFKVLSNRQGIDIGSLMESYTAEILTSTDSPENCVKKIYESKYLLEPYGHFYMCLMPDWLDIDENRTEGYPERMNTVLKADMINHLHGYDYHVFMNENNQKSFKTNRMLPELEEEYEVPQVFYFVPLHFREKVLGYAVLQNDLSSPSKIGITFRNYIRNINNALEMSRTKNRISNLSEYDMMTGLLNRRGMEAGLKELERQSPDDASYLVYVIDMDGLKFINDTYGHSAGDTGITLVSKAVKGIAARGELCVRGGGDEFYLIGLNEYSEKAAEERLDMFREKLEELNEDFELAVPITASIGYSLKNRLEPDALPKAMEEADVNMYICKRAKKAGNNTTV